MEKFTVNITKGINGIDYGAKCNNCSETITETKMISEMGMESHDCSINKLNEKEHDKLIPCPKCKGYHV